VVRLAERAEEKNRSLEVYHQNTEGKGTQERLDLNLLIRNRSRSRSMQRRGSKIGMTAVFLVARRATSFDFPNIPTLLSPTA